MSAQAQFGADLEAPSNSAGVVETVGDAALEKRPKLELEPAQHVNLTRKLATEPLTRAEYFEPHGACHVPATGVAVDEDKSKGPTILCNAIQLLVRTMGICSQTTALVASAAGTETDAEQPSEPPTNGAI